MHVALQGIWVGMALSALAMAFSEFGFIIPAAGAILQERIDVIVTLNALRAGRIKLSSCLSPHLFSHVLKISKISRCVLFVILRSGNVMSL